MKLWLLKPIDDKAGHWQGHWDSVFGFVVRAESEKLAREMVNPEGEDENTNFSLYVNGDPLCYDVWLDPEQTTCVELLPVGESTIILTDSCSG